MRPIVATVTSGNSPFVIPLNYDNVDVGINFGTFVTGTVNYTVNHTYSNVLDPLVTPRWYPHGTSNMVNATTSQESNFVGGIAAMQIVINSGVGSVEVTVDQQGII